MNQLIIYGSKYGSTKMYANELSKRTNIKAIDFKKVESLDKINTVIYFGGLYAGGVLGLSETIKKIDTYDDKKIIIITVGLSNPNAKENIDNIKDSIKKQVPEKVFNKCKIFNLRGSIDYGKLNMMHKIMMKALYNKTKNLPPEKQTSESKALIETYNKRVNFVDFDTLGKIIEII
jgi:menaquinone-dependent protoporphyrinogen IX oxidase